MFLDVYGDEFVKYVVHKCNKSLKNYGKSRCRDYFCNGNDSEIFNPDYKCYCNDNIKFLERVELEDYKKS